MVDYNFNYEWYKKTFYHITNAVALLEKFNFNHGDLWNENVMIKWRPGQEDIPEHKRKFDIKFIDFDSSYMDDSNINNPTLGGGDNYRERFYIGYDLNRYFDALKYTHEKGLKNKVDYRIKKAKKLKIPESELEADSSEEEFDIVNIIYPQKILEFMYSLPTICPEEFEEKYPDGCIELSGKNVLNKLGYKLKDFETYRGGIKNMFKYDKWSQKVLKIILFPNNRRLLQMGFIIWLVSILFSILNWLIIIHT
jgi:preprotein translocase subunit SecE